MKKLVLTTTLFLLTFLLTSCNVNWFGDSLSVPWYWIAVPVFLILLVSYLILMSRTYICPDRKNEFKPKWYEFSVCLHINGKRVVKCPKCGRKGFCSPSNSLEEKK